MRSAASAFFLLPLLIWVSAKPDQILRKHSFDNFGESLTLENGQETTLTTDGIRGRQLQHTHFHPLDCNANLASQPCSDSWSARFTNATYHVSKVLIPCGQCITMDVAAPTLTLAGGLDIQGKLVFPDGYRLNLETPFILIQGELHIRSTRAPDGEKDVSITLIGSDEVEFLPANSNANACSGNSCSIGKKPIAVAGGKLVVEAIKSDTPTWVNLYDVVGDQTSASSALVVPVSVRDRWGVGSQILVTSHTNSYEDGQLRKIAAISEFSPEPGYVVIELDSPIRRPTTVKDNPDYAVEVALLSRNVVFRGATDDSNSLHGAHLIVYHTPMVQQKLEGVEFRNFGQQGVLGRYPIHFHMSNDVTGSIVSKNLVRESNQRCIVVHGTNGLLVDGNVAYDTKGHCFMTEDGNEQNNIFRGNLGALTQRVKTLIKNNGEETDHRPATFWMTNPSNSWEGNVAAGSEFSGFWLELNSEVRGPSADMFSDINPRREELVLFKDNVAHSNRDTGMRTYPSGFFPKEKAVLLNSRFYRNRRNGLFLKKTDNVTIIGGVFADNRKQIDIERSDDIECRDTSVIGVSPEYEALLKKQDVPSVCESDSSVVGIELHIYLKDKGNERVVGASIHNISTSGFVNTGCEQAYVFQFDDDARRASFDYLTKLSSISIEEGAIPIDLCGAERSGVANIYVTDLDSSLRPPSLATVGTSTIVSDKPWMTDLNYDSPTQDNLMENSLFDHTKCVSVPEHCYAYCERTCLRTVKFAVDPTTEGSYELLVCEKTGQTRCIKVTSTLDIEATSDPDLKDIIENTDADRRQVFLVSIPKGAYVSRFLSNQGQEVWPTFVETTYEEPQCSDSLIDDAVDIVIPPVGERECRSLIRNGNAESSDEDHTPWLHPKGGVAVAPGKGIGGSNAFVDIFRTDSNRDAIGQYLDTRCMSLMAGRRYEIKAWVKLVDEARGTVYKCNINDEKCPEAGVYVGSLEDGKDRWAETVSSYTVGDFQLVHGVVKVSSEMARAPNVFFFIQRNKKDLAMYVDHVSVELMEDFSSCRNLVSNGDFSSGDTRFWRNNDSDGVVVVRPGTGGLDDFALEAVDGTVQQLIQINGIPLGTQFVATAKFKLVGPNGVHATCNAKSKRNDRCPEMWLQPVADGEQGSPIRITTLDGSSSSEWSTMCGAFTTDESFAFASSIKLTFRHLPSRMDLIVDDVVVQKLSSDCGFDLGSETLLDAWIEDSCPGLSSGADYLRWRMVVLLCVMGVSLVALF